MPARRSAVTPATLFLLLTVAACQDPIAAPSSQATGTIVAKSVGSGYTIIDLSPAAGYYGFSVALTNSGMVAGTVDNFGFLWRGGSATNIGNLGEDYTTVTGMNESGAVVGQSAVSFSPYVSHGFSWQRGVMTDLGALPGGDYSRATAVNAAGAVVGVATTGGELHPFLWRNGEMIDLGTLGPDPFGFSRADAVAINASGWVTGVSTAPGTYFNRGFVWRNGTMTDLGIAPGGSYVIPMAMNAAGQIAGEMATGGKRDGFLWTNGVMRALDLPGSLPGVPVVLNDRGEVAGSILIPNFTNRGFIWRDGVTTDLGDLGGDWVNATGINNRGQVVGYSTTPICCSDFRAFVWTDGTIVDLGTLPGGTSSWATGINERGEIIGSSMAADFRIHPVMWTPKQQ